MYMIIGAYKNVASGTPNINQSHFPGNDQGRIATFSTVKRWVKLGWLIIVLRIVSWFVVGYIFYDGMLELDDRIYNKEESESRNNNKHRTAKDLCYES